MPASRESKSLSHPLTQDEQEWWVLNETRKFSCASSLLGETSKSESPDFRVDTQIGVVGIEVTEAICWRDAAARTDFYRASKAVRNSEKVDLPEGVSVAADRETMLAFSGAFRKDVPMQWASRRGDGREEQELLSACIERKCKTKYTSNWPDHFVQQSLVVYLNPANSVFVPSFERLFETWRPTFSFYDSVFVLRSSGSEVCRFRGSDNSSKIESL